MLELNETNTADYLRECGWVNPQEPVTVTPMGWGVSNAVFRVETPDRRFVLKQSRPQLRTRDAWFSDLDRVWREMEVMQMLEPLLPPDTVPRVLYSDRENYAFAMSHAPTSQVWKEQLLAGQVEPERGGQAGRILGRTHDLTARHPEYVEAFADRTVFVQLRVDPFYRRIQDRVPEVASAVERLIERMMSSRVALCHGDYSPKNILTHSEGFTLVDYETAHQGDPAMDLGFCLSHLVLKLVRDPSNLARYNQLLDAFWKAYWAENRSLDPVDLERWGMAHLGLCLLARIDGTSPVDYLTDLGDRNRVRQMGKSILLDSCSTWDKVRNSLQNHSPVRTKD
jgi:aminoglycoside phosphotransferase (APT) family kinase protein